MSFYFNNFPLVSYNFKKNNNFELLTNITLRYKIRDIIKSTASIFYEYSVKDEDRPDIIAHKYYNNSTLDWIILITNDIIDPYYDWPLNNDNFNKYMTNIYGSVSSSQTTVYEYRQILSEAKVTFDNKIIPKRTVVVDLNTYNSLVATDREIIYAYDYYQEQNDKKRNIRLIDKEFVEPIISEVRNIFA